MAVLNRAAVDRITAEARALNAGRALLTLLASVLFAVGWVAAVTCRGVWFVLAWSFAAVKVGWTDARGRS